MGVPRRFKNLLASLLTRIGARTKAETIRKLNAVLNYLEVGRWMTEHGFTPTTRVKHRRILFEQLAEKIGHSRILYMEFGVFQGESIRLWSDLLKNPQSHLHGFDSFEGLPEDWNAAHPRGYFSTAGQMPKIDDPRVKFFAGWFDRTLPGYQAPAHDQLIVNIDCDLYTSTKMVLDSLQSKDLIKPGTYIYFDEFSDRDHELKVFHELLKSTNWKFALIGATCQFSRVIFQRIE